jgi:hypothetical protein
MIVIGEISPTDHRAAGTLPAQNRAVRLKSNQGESLDRARKRRMGPGTEFFQLKLWVFLRSPRWCVEKKMIGIDLNLDRAHLATTQASGEQDGFFQRQRKRRLAQSYAGAAGRQ